jgi:hypothetical protein
MRALAMMAVGLGLKATVQEEEETHLLADQGTEAKAVLSTAGQTESPE